MLGECFIEFAVYSSMPALEAATRARSSAQRALDLDPSVAEAHEVLARAAAALDYDWKECEREFQLAMSREPISPRLRWSYAHNCLLAIGQLKECERELNLALEDDPINALSRFSLGLCLHSAGRLAEAEGQFRQVLELDAHFIPAAYWLVRNHAAKGAIAEALALAETLLPLAPSNPEVVGGLAGLLRRSGKRKRAGELLDRLGDGTGYGAPLGFLSYYFLLGESERAAGWMGKAIDERHVLVPLYVRTPLARSLLESPDWPALAIKMNLGADR
jgi:tetratricopeptide (TPR) repeat protein